MPIYEDKRVCFGCGRMGVAKTDCPVCKSCVYCKQKGHVVSSCPRVPPCGYCGQKGHKTSRCRATQHRIQSLEIPEGPLQKQHQDHSLNITVASELHDEAEWQEMSSEVRDVSRTLKQRSRMELTAYFHRLYTYHLQLSFPT